jgi:transposase
MDKFQNEILVGIDVGSDGHQIAISTPNGDFVYEGDIQHQHIDFNAIIEQLRNLERVYQARVVIGIKGYNGHIAPFDQMLTNAGFEVLNVNPSRLYHFRHIFGAPYKNDQRDVRLVVGYLRARHLLNTPTISSKSLLPIKAGSDLHKRLKSLSRYLNELIKEQTRIRNRLTKRLKEYLSELLTLAKQANRKWLIILLAHCSKLSELKQRGLEEIKTLKGITGYRIGPKRAAQIKAVVASLEFHYPLEEEYAFILLDHRFSIRSRMKRRPMFYATSASGRRCGIGLDAG